MSKQPFLMSLWDRGEAARVLFFLRHLPRFQKLGMVPAIDLRDYEARL